MWPQLAKKGSKQLTQKRWRRTHIHTRTYTHACTSAHCVPSLFVTAIPRVPSYTTEIVFLMWVLQGNSSTVQHHALLWPAVGTKHTPAPLSDCWHTFYNVCYHQSFQLSSVLFTCLCVVSCTQTVRQIDKKSIFQNTDLILSELGCSTLITWWQCTIEKFRIGLLEFLISQLSIASFYC